MAEPSPRLLMAVSPKLTAAEQSYRERFDSWLAALKDARAASWAQQGPARNRLHLAQQRLQEEEAELAGLVSFVLRTASPPAVTTGSFEWRWPVNPNPVPGALAPDKVRNTDVTHVFDLLGSLVNAVRRFAEVRRLAAGRPIQGSSEARLTEALTAAEAELVRWGWRPGGSGG